MGSEMCIRDRNNNLALIDIMNARTPQGDWARRLGDIPAALEAYAKAVAAVEKMDGPNAPYSSLDALVQVHHRMAAALQSAGQLDAALLSLGKAERYLNRAEKLNPGTTRGALREAEIGAVRADVFAAQKKWPEAIASYTAVISIYESQRLRDPKNESLLSDQPDLYAKLADGYAAVGDRANAVRAMNTAIERTRELEARRPLVHDEEQGRQSNLAKLSEWAAK